MAQQDTALMEWLALPDDRRKTMMQASDFANEVALARVGSGSKHNIEYQRVMNLIHGHVSRDEPWASAPGFWTPEVLGTSSKRQRRTLGSLQEHDIPIPLTRAEPCPSSTTPPYMKDVMSCPW